MTDFSKGVWRQELTLLEARGVRWNFGNHDSSRAVGHVATQPSVPTTVTHLLLSFPHFFDSSFSMAKKNENTLSIFLFKLGSSVVSNPKSRTQLGSLPLHISRSFVFKGHLTISWEWKEFAGRDGQGWGERKWFYFILQLILILLLDFKNWWWIEYIQESLVGPDRSTGTELFQIGIIVSQVVLFFCLLSVSNNQGFFKN